MRGNKFGSEPHTPWFATEGGCRVSRQERHTSLERVGIGHRPGSARVRTNPARFRAALVCGQSSDFQQQVVAFRGARGLFCRQLIVVKRRLDLTRALEQVSAYGSEPIVIFDPRIAIEWLEQREPS